MAPRRASRSPARARQVAQPVAEQLLDHIHELEDQLFNLRNDVHAIESHLSDNQIHWDVRLFVTIALTGALIFLGCKSRKGDAYDTLGALLALVFIFSRPRWLHKKWWW